MRKIKVNSKENEFGWVVGDKCFKFNKPIPAMLAMYLLVPDEKANNYEFCCNKDNMAKAVCIYDRPQKTVDYIIKKLIKTFNITIVDSYEIIE